MIEIRDLQKRFGTLAAVDGISFTAPQGRVTGLLGPNGAGKTTTIRMMGTLIAPDAGTIRIDGIDAVRDPAGARRTTGFLTDSRGLYTRLTARENIRYYARLRGIGDAQSAAVIERLAEWLDMRDILDRRTEGFSQGERMKVAIARALVHEPPTVVLDEPTNGLDVMTTRSLRQLIRRLKAEGRTVLFSSHIMQEVAALCDEIVIVSRGRIVAQGTADDLLTASGCASLEDAFVRLAGIDDEAATHHTAHPAEAA